MSEYALTLTVDADGTAAVTNIKRVSGSVDELGSKTDGTAKRIQTAGKEIGDTFTAIGKRAAVLSAALAGFGALSVRSFATFDEAMTQSLAIMGAVEDEMKNNMANAARELALEVSFSASEIAESYFFLASAGLSAEQQLAALPQVARFAQAGAFDMAQATDLATDAQSALGLSVEDNIQNLNNLTRVTDVLVGANTLANASVAQFSEALTNKAGAAMRLLNIEMETGVAVLAAWADQGVKGSEAGERFNIVTRDLQTAARNNNELFKQMGIEVFDANDELNNLADIVADLEIALDGMGAKTRGSTLSMLGFQDRSVQAISSLLGLSNQIREYENDLKGMAGITQEVADKQLEAFSKQIGLIRDRLNDLMITIGSDLAPMILDLLERVEPLIDTFREMDDETRKWVVGLGLLGAALSPVLIFTGLLIKSLTSLAPLIAGTTKAVVGLNTAVGLTTGLIGGVATAIGLLAVAIERKYTPGMEEVALSAQIFNTVQRAVIILRETLLGLGEVMLGVMVTVTGGLRQLISPIEGAIRSLANATDNLLEGNVRAALSSLAGIGEQIGEAWEKGRKTVEKGIGFTSESIKERVGNALREVTELQNDLLRGDVPESETAMAKFGDNIKRAIDMIRNFEMPDLGEDGVGLNLPDEKELNRLKNQLADIDRLYDNLLRNLRPQQAALNDFEDGVKLASNALRDKQISLTEYVRLLALLQEQYVKTMQSLQDDTLDDSARSIERLVSRIESMNVNPITRDLADLRNALEHATDPEMIERLERAIVSVQGEMRVFAIDSIGAGLQSLQSLAKEGTRAYQAIDVAIQIANISAGIAAILNQGMGDPYTAFARMAAMAAMVASLGVSIAGSFGSGNSDTAANRQATQGTRSVLGDIEAQSESILKSSEITALATTELVGINRGMLRALQALQSGISSASGMLARSAGSTEFDGVNVPDTGPLPQVFADIGSFLDPGGFLHGIFNAIHKWFGGKAKVIDEGIEILGGTIAELIEGTLVGAYQTVRSRSWRFGSWSNSDEFQELPDDIQNQFSLIFGAIADSVMQGALALGLAEQDIQNRINTFIVEAQKISLHELTAEEQQEELLAIFSKIFDDLAGHVVPFIDQFQQVGEGLGETLIRVATSVQVAKEAFDRLGFSIGEQTPEALAQISVALVEAVGGIEQFINQMENFVNTFAPASHQFSISQSDMARALEQVGLTLPDTRDGFWELMQSLDATTDEGREQIATLLRLTDTARQYYDLLKDQNEIQKQLLFRRDLGLTGLGFTPPTEPEPPVIIIDPTPGPGQPLPPSDPIPGPVGPTPGPILIEPPMDRIQSMQTFIAVLEGTGDAADIALPHLQHHLSMIEELARGNESLVDTFERLSSVMNTLDTVIAINNVTLSKSRDDLIRFGDELTNVFGDDLRHLSSNFNQIFSTFFTDEEMTGQQMNVARQRAGALLADLGVEMTEEMLTRSGFRELFDELFEVFVETGNAEALAILSEAGAAIGELIELEESLNDVRQDSNSIAIEREGLERRILELQNDFAALRQLEIDAIDESNRDLLDRIHFLEDEQFMVDQLNEIMKILSPFRAQAEQLRKEQEKSLRMVQMLEMGEVALTRARRLTELQNEELNRTIMDSIRSLNEQLFGQQDEVGNAFVRSARSIRDGVINALNRIDEWLDRSLLSNISTLLPTERLNEAERQFQEAFSKAMAGDADAISMLPRLADQFLGEGAQFFGTSTNAFAEIERNVREAMQQVAGIETARTTPTHEQVSNIERSNRNIELSSFEQLQLASQMIDQIAFMSQRTDQSAFDIAAGLDVPITDLIRVLTGETPTMIGDELEDYFNNLADITNEELDALVRVEDIAWDQLTELRNINETLKGYDQFLEPWPDEDQTIIKPMFAEQSMKDNKVLMSDLVRENKEINEKLNRLLSAAERSNDQDAQKLVLMADGFGAVVTANDRVKHEVKKLNRPESRR